MSIFFSPETFYDSMSSFVGSGELRRTLCEAIIVQLDAIIEVSMELFCCFFDFLEEASIVV